MEKSVEELFNGNALWGRALWGRKRCAKQKS